MRIQHTPSRRLSSGADNDSAGRRNRGPDTTAILRNIRSSFVVEEADTREELELTSANNTLGDSQRLAIGDDTVEFANLNVNLPRNLKEQQR